MSKIMYDQALFILHKKNVKPSHFHDVIEKEVFDSHSKRKSFHGSENAELLDHCSFYTNTENFGNVLFHLNS